MSKSENIPQATPGLEAVMPCSLESLMPWLLRARTEMAELKGMSRIMEEREGLLHPLFLLDTLEMAAREDILLGVTAAFEQQLFTEAEQSSAARLILRSRDLLMDSILKPAAGENQGKTLETLLWLQSGISGKTYWRKNALNPGRNNTDAVAAALPEEIEGLLANLEEFIGTDHPSMDPLVKWIMVHYQLEVVKPFAEHNGFLSQVYLNLQLANTGLLRYPLINLSAYLRRNQGNYHRMLREVKTGGNWSGYLRFMLHGFASQARYTREKISQILKAKNELNRRIQTECKGVYSLELVRLLTTYPVISPLRLSSRLDIHYTTATRYLKKLADDGFLTNRQSGKYQLYSNPELITILTEVKDEFTQIQGE